MTSRPLLFLILATTLIRLAFAATTGLGMDESYMVAAGRVWSLGYFDHPPAAWWLSHGAAVLFGTEAPIAVRLPFILLFALSQYLTARITRRLADDRAAFRAVVALNLSPVFGVTTGTWVLPDGPLDAALLGAVLCLLHALNDTAARRSRRLRWWAAAGLCAGLALFSKYSAVLSMGGAFLYLLAMPGGRRRFAEPGPYVALAAAVLAFSPVLIWNAAHGWASFAFQGSRAVGGRLHPLGPLATLGGEALFVLPWIWLPMMAVFVRGFRSGEAWQRRLLVWLAAPPIVVFAAISAWSSQRILFHWAAPGYLMLFPLLGVEIARRTGSCAVRRLIAGTAVLTVAATATISVQIQTDWLGGALAALTHKDPTEEGLDWTSIRDDLRSRGLLPPGTLVAALGWRDAGKFGYALGPDVEMLCLSDDARQFGFARPVRDFAGRDVLVLIPGPVRGGEDEAKHWFDSVSELTGTSIRIRGRVLRGVTVLRGEGLHSPR